MKKNLKHHWLFFCVMITTLLVPVALCAGDEKVEQNLTVSEGKKITLEYTIRLHDRTVVYTNAGKDPLTYVHGDDQVVEKLQKELEGMKVGDDQLIIIHPGEGYGLFNEKNIIETEKTKVPGNALHRGAQVQAIDENGQKVVATVKEIRDDTVVLEIENPLEGKTLYFNVKILNIQ